MAVRPQQLAYIEACAGVAMLGEGVRADQLRCVGNGVVALCASTAFVLLARRLGLNENSNYERTNDEN